LLLLSFFSPYFNLWSPTSALATQYHRSKAKANVLQNQSVELQNQSESIQGSQLQNLCSSFSQKSSKNGSKLC